MKLFNKNVFDYLKKYGVDAVTDIFLGKVPRISPTGLLLTDLNLIATTKTCFQIARYENIRFTEAKVQTHRNEYLVVLVTDIENNNCAYGIAYSDENTERQNLIELATDRAHSEITLNKILLQPFK